MMDIACPETVDYRVLVVDPSSRKVLVRKGSPPFSIFRISILSGGRLARELQHELRRLWELDVFILDFLSTGADGSRLVVAELLRVTTSAKLASVHLNQIGDDEVSECERTLFLRLLRQDASCSICHMGWGEEAIAWTENATGCRVDANTGVEQYNAGGPFSLLHFRMEDEQSYWLKATDAPNRHERLVTGLLCALCSSSLPQMVAEMPSWNAWLMSGEGWSLPALPTEPRRLVRFLGEAVESLAKLQIASIGAKSALFEAGAFDQRPHVLRTEMEELFEYLCQAMSHQDSTNVPRIGLGRLLEIQAVSNRVLDHAECLGIPSTIVHGDMNLGNLVFTENSCHVIDWSEAYIGYPLVTFQHLLLLSPAVNAPDKAYVESALKAIYQSAFHQVCDPEQMEEGFVCMPLLAALSTIHGRGDWLHADARNDPRRQKYTRCITRYLDRYANDPRLSETLGVHSRR